MRTDLQLCDVLDFVDGAGGGVRLRVGGVEAIHIRQQEEPVRVHHGGHLHTFTQHTSSIIEFILYAFSDE